MCGINGIIFLKKVNRDYREEILLMNNEIKHRGPDDEGYVFINKTESVVCGGDDTMKVSDLKQKPVYFPEGNIKNVFLKEAQIVLSHRRLSIIDLSEAGHQPMSLFDRYWIVYNGEIYNYIELKKELISIGYNFKTNSDTEVLLTAYHEWGVDCLKRFNGMWAFLIYDNISDKLFISRDRFGVKPLNYYIDDEKIIFSSEIKSILKNPYITTSPNRKYITDFVKEFPKEHLSETAFENIYHFPNSSYSEIALRNINNIRKLKIIKFWDVNINLSEDKYNEEKNKELIEDYINLLNESVSVRLRSDVPVGTAFSGGIDSSTIVHVVNTQLRKSSNESKQRTFSIVFKSTDEYKKYDESYFIGIMKKQYNLNSFEIEPTPEMVKEQYKKTVYTMDTPQEDALMSCMFTYKLVSDNSVVVTLDGQGADELQGGYLRYLSNYIAHLKILEIKKTVEKFTKIPNAKKEILIGILSNFILKLKLSGIFLKIFRFFGKYGDPFISLNEKLYKDFTENLQNLLHFGDRSSMAYSVETRYPFLDFRMVDFWFSLPACYKLNDGWTKYLARKALSGLLPEEIVWRKDKMGWETPQFYWFNGILKDWVGRTLNNHPVYQYIDFKINVDKIYKRMNNDYSSFKLIMKLFNLCIWYDIFFQKQTNDL